MKWVMYISLAAEAVLVGCALTQAIASDLAVLLIAANSVLLIWTAAQLLKKPSCCR